MWHDDHRYDQATSKLANIAYKIKDCKVFICFLTGRYAGSEYYMRELFYARKYGKTIIPILLEEFEMSKKLEEEISHFEQFDLDHYETIGESIDELIGRNYRVLDSCREKA
jgi:hypothetical protein